MNISVRQVHASSYSTCHVSTVNAILTSDLPPPALPCSSPLPAPDPNAVSVNAKPRSSTEYVPPCPCPPCHLVLPIVTSCPTWPTQPSWVPVGTPTDAAAAPPLPSRYPVHWACTSFSSLGSTDTTSSSRTSRLCIAVSRECMLKAQLVFGEKPCTRTWAKGGSCWICRCWEASLWSWCRSWVHTGRAGCQWRADVWFLGLLLSASKEAGNSWMSVLHLGLRTMAGSRS